VTPRTVRLVGVGCLDAAAIGLFPPDWRSLASGLAHPQIWVAQEGADSVAVTMAGTALWLVALWLAVGLVALAVATAPGRLGEVGSWFTDRLLPGALTRTVAGAVGLSVAFAPVAAGAETVTPTATTSAATLAAPPTWPSDSSASRPDINLAPPSLPLSLPVSDAPPAQLTASPTITVQPGDSLWLIAPRRLGSSATGAQLRAATDRWYATNHAVIGADPNLIRPGTVLDVPPTN
jgi:nucleoid-associated protein YgaU